MHNFGVLEEVEKEEEGIRHLNPAEDLPKKLTPKIQHKKYLKKFTTENPCCKIPNLVNRP